MKQTINIEGKDLELNNSAEWALVYRDQFNHDIIPTVMPLLAGILDILGGMASAVSDKKDGDGKISVEQFLIALDDGSVFDALIHLSGFELVELYNITWAMNKAANADIQEPREWIKQFDVFPLDDIAPAIFGLMIKGLMSSKNWTRLESLMKTIQPSISMSSSPQQQSEDSTSET